MEKRATLNLLFFIKRTKLLRNAEAPVYMRITVNGKRLELSINRSIELEKWSSVKGAAIGNTKEARSLNMYIDAIRTQLHSYIQFLRESDKPISAQSIKNKYLGIDDKGETILKLYKEHNENATKLIGIDYVADSVQRHTTTYRHIQNFIKKKYDEDDLEIKYIDYKFITDLIMYFKIDMGVGHNTAMKYLKNLKKIIRIAIARGIINRDPYLNVNMKIKQKERDFLSEDELNKIINHKFSIERLEQVKDAFLFSCFTGLAHIDLKRLTLSNIQIGTDGAKWIKTKRKKTNGVSNIPMLPITEMLIDKYKKHPYCLEKEVLLPVLSNQKMNAYLKEIADICGIEKNLTSHVARHTFATTVTLNNDVPIETVSKMLGHSSIKMTKIYAKLLDKKVGRDMQHLHDKFNIESV